MKYLAMASWKNYPNIRNMKCFKQTFCFITFRILYAMRKL